ncbi:type IX secretion system membrane protein PorP/SprF [Chitinophaga polysaccharea]|uniref:PorP/SprF family type IX secretion system membrane protein n=1 Tax=Chitinophaga TaxID=79328 RepID=UPI0014552FA6|nr:MULTISPECIES: type IX secretion system membrane protein PorP/SprF [Chitinophaga]NLR62083.1 type IX secretion system membrane protein PorP/SprF [Chitinophaga polysaccharea]NLU96426.1 type IX secretion system membrane protein PorP/SprF [Chitinophaga sp. Ak27]
MCIKKYFVFLVSLLVGGHYAQAQQDAQFSQYIFNGIYINPAYAGSRQELNAHAFYRDQWVGIAGAPQTMSLAVDGNVNDDRIGLALQVSSDKIGAQSQLSAYGNYAYRIPLGSESGRLALGIGAGIVQQGLDPGKLDFTNPNEPNISGAAQHMLLFDMRAGIYYSTANWFVGFSADNLTAQYQAKNKPLAHFIPVPKPHYYLTAGALFPVNDDVMLKPSFLLKDDRGGPTSLDMNMFVLLKEMVWLGGGYRTAVNIYNKPDLQPGLTKSSAAVAMAEVFVIPELRIGYAFDYALNKYRTYNNGTHEISIGYYFKRMDSARRTSLRQVRCSYF